MKLTGKARMLVVENPLNGNKIGLDKIGVSVRI